jgi:AcrR family transcriptional regulator
MEGTRVVPPGGPGATLEADDGFSTPVPIYDREVDPILAALVDLAAEKGLDRVTEAEVCRRAGVDRAYFRRRYLDLEGCALAAFEELERSFWSHVHQAFESREEWTTSLRAAAYATADWLAVNPNAAAFGAMEVLKMRSELVRVRREGGFISCAGLIDQGRLEAEDPDEIPDSAALFAIGSIVQSITLKLQRGEALEPHSEVPRLMFAAVLPFRGEAAASRELTMPRP